MADARTSRFVLPAGHANACPPLSRPSRARPSARYSALDRLVAGDIDELRPAAAAASSEVPHNGNGPGHIAFRTDDNCIIDVADPTALQRFADQVTPQLVEHLILHWLRQLPDPLTREERAAGYPLRFSIYQAEFSHNVIFTHTQVLNRVYEALLRDHLHLGRPDMLKVIFDRRIQRNTPSVYVTRILRRGVVTCLKVFYKHSWLKQYNKGGRVLRTEIYIK